MNKNKEIIEKYYSAFNRQAWGEMLSLLDAEVVHDINQGGIEIGKDAFKKFLSVMDEHYEEQVKELVVFANDANRAAAEFFIEGVYKKTQATLPEAKNQKYKIRVGAFFEIKNGRISRVTNYYNLPKWIELVSK